MSKDHVFLWHQLVGGQPWETYYYMVITDNALYWDLLSYMPWGFDCLPLKPEFERSALWSWTVLHFDD